MIEIPLNDGYILSSFFKHTHDSCPEAFLHGVMGRGFTDSLDHPAYGIIQVGDFCFLDGNEEDSSDQNTLALLNDYFQNPGMIFIPLSESWSRQFDMDPAYSKDIRYAMNKPDIRDFNKEQLISYICQTAYDLDYPETSFKDDFIIQPINEEYYHTVQQHAWSKDFTSNYPDYSSFNHLGFGFLIIEKVTGTLAAGASSFSSSLDSIEIEIATNPDYRKRGLATAVSAKMVLECIKRNKYPSWDAANRISVAVAQKLGYRFKEEYTCYKLVHCA